MGYLSCRDHDAIAILNPPPGSRTCKSGERRPRSNPRHFRYEELESATGGFSEEALLGKGSQRHVYRAVLDNGRLTAAVKRSIMGTNGEGSSAGCRSSRCSYNGNPGENEVEILSVVRSPRFVNLIGFSLEEKGLIVVELMRNGTLHEQLHLQPRPPGWPRRLKFALQIARAVESLHTSDPPVIHRDIKSSNVLIDDHWNARLGDFGLALRGPLSDLRLRPTPPAGTLGYLDPSYITPESLSTKSDVFSFGILLLEIISGRNAIDVNYSPPYVLDWAVPLILNRHFNSLCDPRVGAPKDSWLAWQLSALATRCTRSVVEERPSMGEVVDYLQAVRKNIPLPIWNGLAARVKNRKVSNAQYGVDSPE